MQLNTGKRFFFVIGFSVPEFFLFSKVPALNRPQVANHSAVYFCFFSTNHFFTLLITILSLIFSGISSAVDYHWKALRANKNIRAFQFSLKQNAFFAGGIAFEAFVLFFSQTNQPPLFFAQQCLQYFEACLSASAIRGSAVSLFRE